MNAEQYLYLSDEQKLAEIDGRIVRLEKFSKETDRDYRADMAMSNVRLLQNLKGSDVEQNQLEHPESIELWAKLTCITFDVVDQFIKNYGI